MLDTALNDMDHSYRKVKTEVNEMAKSNIKELKKKKLVNV